MGDTFRTLHRAHTMFIFAYVMAACVGIFQAEIDVIDAERMKPISA